MGSVCSVLAVVLTVTLAMADCTDPEFIKALKTTYELKENEELWQTAKRVACSDSTQGFATNAEILIPTEAPAPPIPAKGALDYKEVRKACKESDDAFFKKYAKTLTIRFLPDWTREVLLACLPVTRLVVKAEFTGGSCKDVVVTATWMPHGKDRQKVTVDTVQYPDSSFQCSGINRNTVLEADSNRVAHCTRIGDNQRPFIYTVTPRKGQGPAGTSQALRAVSPGMNVQTGVNILEKNGVNRYEHTRNGDLKSCQKQCLDDKQCAAFAYRHIAEGPDYPNECWLYGEPRDKFFTGEYRVITSGIKEPVAACK